MANQLQLLNEREHIQSRAMWLGSNQEISQSILLATNDNKLAVEQQSFIPLIMSAFDEIIVNTFDQKNRYYNLVTVIEISLLESGRIIIKNNGPGIPIIFNQEYQQWSITLICNRLYSGANFNDSIRTTGGSNGCGLKLVNFNSSNFTVTTINNEIKFTQTFKKGATIIEQPIIDKVDKSVAEFTALEFELSINDKNIVAEEIEKYNQLFLSRIILAALWLTKKSTRLIYNYKNSSTQFLYNSLVEFAENHISTSNSNSNSNSNSTSNSNKIKTVDIITNQATNNYDLLIFTGQKQNTVIVSIINGLIVYEGNHLKNLFDIFYSAVEKQARQFKKDISRQQLKKYITILLRCKILNPQFDSQSKKNLLLTKSQLELLNFTALNFSKEAIKNLLLQIFADQQTKLLRRKNIFLCKDIEKYQKALKANSKESQKCTLFIVEGDSAMSMVQEGIKTCLNNDYYGIISLQGVILNSRKQVEQKGTLLQQSDSLVKNKVLMNLEKIIGLRRGEHYTKDSIQNLSYGNITVVVDQDTDGIGNIFGLLLSHFHLFWKELFALNFIYRLNTPIIRIFEKTGKYLNFYSKEQFQCYLRTLTTAQQVDIKYYKGLAGHYGQFVKDIFEHFRDNKLLYQCDQFSQQLFESFFGKNVDLRKQELLKPIDYRDIYYKNSQINCSDHLAIETKQFQLENIERKLPHMIDGLMLTRRKILYGSILLSQKSTKELKVFQLGGEIARKTYYHHGEQSLQNTIICMAQSFYGARQFPYLTAIGQFGTRQKGGKDAGQARYISTNLNKRLVELLFPFADLPELDYRQEDGVIVEPQYFIPIIPTVLIDNYELPATGWKVSMHARNIHHVIFKILEMIEVDSITTINTNTTNATNATNITNITNTNTMTSDILPTYDKNYYRINSSEYSIGSYKILTDQKLKKQVQSCIEITELPIGIWTDDYLAALRKKEYVYDFIDKSGNNDISIIVYLTVSIDTIIKKYSTSTFNGIIKYFNLAKKIIHNLNCTSINNTVKSFNSYSEILTEWFPIRKQLYQRRVERIRFLLTAKITVLENQIRFLLEHFTDSMNYTLQDLVQKIIKEKYISINLLIIKSHNSYKLEQLKELIYTNNNYEYLLNLRYRDSTKENIERLKKKLSQKREQLQLPNLIYGNYPGQLLWIEELNKLLAYLDTTN